MKWLAVYKDGTHLAQYNGDETENRYLDINRNCLSHFAILAEDNNIILSIEFARATQKLIYRTRTFMDIEGNIKGRIILAGWHENINGTSIKVISYIYPNGKIILAGAKDDLQFVPCEGD